MAKQRNKAPAREVRVRMYRQGLGDCFLLTFPRRSKPFHMLVDCGVLLGTPDQEAKMQEVANDIATTCDGRLDLLVATHEHWDHLSGFAQAQEVFEKIDVRELWLAWTEDPEDARAAELRQGRRAALKALHVAAQRLHAAGSARAEQLTGLLEFSGPLGARSAVTTASALAILRKKVERPRFCSPGKEPLQLDDVEDVRIHVLGPPRDDRIKKSDPTKRGREVYELALEMRGIDAILAAVTSKEKSHSELSVDELIEHERSLPFDNGQGIERENAAKDKLFGAFFTEFYFGVKGKRDKVAGWRQIEDDWLGAADGLALKLDSDTNNTSLVLAIELGEGGPVLLFPGDAQVGNWLSWGDYAWPAEGKPDDPKTITLERLLKRTVLYKVGHHGSHNATLRDRGLELMTSADLVVMIPVDEVFATTKKHWAMPFPGLHQRLQAKTKGRILRADRSAKDIRDLEQPSNATAAEWQEFLSRLGQDPKDKLWIEYRVPF